MRALLEEAYNGLLAYSVLHPEHDTELVERIRGALAQAAVTEQPSDDDLYDLDDQHAGEHVVAAMRAAQARWRRPASPAEEVAELVAWLRLKAAGERDMCPAGNGESVRLDRAADLLELTQQQGADPTDDELNALWCCSGVADEHGNHTGNIFEFARAVLARWGRPAPPLSQHATTELDDAVTRGDCITTTDAMPVLRNALQRFAEVTKDGASSQ